MKKMMFSLFAIFLLFVLTACGTDKDLGESSEKEINTEQEPVKETSPSDSEDAVLVLPQLNDEVATNEALIIMNTTLGSIKIKLFPDIAPKTVKNFLTHAENGYYDGIIFHRVMDEFMIQGGDPTGSGRGGESIYGDSFEDEFSRNAYNFRGALSMANAGPNTNGSQFFIVQATQFDESTLNPDVDYSEKVVEAYVEMGGTAHLDQKHTVFGQVIEGMDTVDKIAKVEAKATKPVDDVVIESIEILQDPTK
ncbi:peptidylprolyl isomerase [Sporosarcina sp. CAU 1771]